MKKKDEKAYRNGKNLKKRVKENTEHEQQA